MEDIITNNYYNVLGELDKSPKHMREISRNIGLSHTQVGKILNYFFRLGVLEKKQIGKTIIYKIKKNNLSLNYLIVWKKLKLINLIQKNKKIKTILEELFLKIGSFVKNIDCLILFGSYSKGYQNKNSDVDLFFISNESEKDLKKKIGEIEDSFGVEINFKVLNKKNFEKKLDHPLTIEVLEGIPLINSEYFYKLKWKT